MIRSGVSAAAFYRIEDLIERHHDVLEFAEINLQREIRARHQARNRDRARPRKPRPNFVVRTGTTALRVATTTIGP